MQPFPCAFPGPFPLRFWGKRGLGEGALLQKGPLPQRDAYVWGRDKPPQKTSPRRALRPYTNSKKAEMGRILPGIPTKNGAYRNLDIPRTSL